MRIETIYRYPVKGMTAEAMEEVALTPGATLPEDRRFALARGDSAFDARSGELFLRLPGQPPLSASTRTEQGRAAIATALTAYLGNEARGSLRFVEAPGHSFSDVAKKVVSIIGLSSLHALEKVAGMPLDPLRFRANVYVSGGSPWAEFDWIGQEIQLGQARLRVVKRIVRCAATEVNPATGERDATPPRWLRDHFGHLDLGVYAEVIDGGRIAGGDALEALTPAD